MSSSEMYRTPAMVLPAAQTKSQFGVKSNTKITTQYKSETKTAFNNHSQGKFLNQLQFKKDSLSKNMKPNECLFSF